MTALIALLRAAPARGPVADDHRVVFARFARALARLRAAAKAA